MASRKSTDRKLVKDQKMFDAPWHQLDVDEMGKEVAGLFEYYKSDQQGRRTRYVRNAEMYEGRLLGGYSAHSYFADSYTSAGAYGMDRLRLIRSAVSSAVASIYAAQKPKPQFQTLGANWKTRRKAYKLDRICECILNQRQERWINIWSMMIDAGVESVLQGTACIRVTADTLQKRIAHKLIPSPDVFFDPAEGRDPCNLFYREPIDEGLALKQWPEHRVAIRGAREYQWYTRATTTRKRAAKTIELQYAYRLPFGEDDPGKWCAVINGTVVDSGDWEEPTFPFVFLHWEPHREGPWSSGVADEAGELADSCGDLSLRLEMRARIAAKKRTFYVKDSCKPDDLALNAEETVIPIDPGVMFPVSEVTPPFTPTDMEFLNAEIRQFWDAIGISQVSAAARREQGVSSGIAMMTLNDTKAGRQLVKAQRYEQAYVDLAHQWIRRLREIEKETKGFKLRWPGKNMMREIDFSDVSDLDDDMFSVSVAPASNLPHDPAGRQEMVQELFASQMISKDTARQLIGWPDLDSELAVDSSETEYIDMLIERYLDAEQDRWGNEDYQAPEGFLTNKMGALRRFAAAWFRARIDQSYLEPKEQAVAEFNIKLITRYITELDAKMQEARMAEVEMQRAAQFARPGEGLTPTQAAQVGAQPPPQQQRPPVPVAA